MFLLKTKSKIIIYKKIKHWKIEKSSVHFISRVINVHTEVRCAICVIFMIFFIFIGTKKSLELGI